jgi:phosphohistidine phosphatase SixA/8-oxo-dGTP pyrophosphatase MutT (NUDIX family)
VSDVVRAAGGVILRRKDGALQTLLVHRPRYDDLTFPKGKANDGEPDEETAIREVLEETGLSCRRGPELVRTAYRDPAGRPKEVRYWLLRPKGDGEFRPSREIDRVEWIDVAEAPDALTYPRDRPVLDAATGLAEPLYLLRHAKAGSRAPHWRGDDELRPLTVKGRRQAEGIAAAFRDRPVAEVLSSPSLRCVQTVEPLARLHGLDVRAVDWLAEGTPVSVARSAIVDLPGPAVLCSHGDVIPELVLGLANEGIELDGPVAWKKASIWILERDEGFPSLLRYVPPPRDRAPGGSTLGGSTLGDPAG